MISTKGRYALRVMLSLAKQERNKLVSLETIAEDQGISKKYLEIVIRHLVRDGLVEGLRGKGGGYRLMRNPEEYSVLEIIESAEGDLAPVACLKKGSESCSRSEICLTLPLWERFDSLTENFFGSITLQDVLDGHYPDIPVPITLHSDKD